MEDLSNNRTISRVSFIFEEIFGTMHKSRWQRESDSVRSIISGNISLIDVATGQAETGTLYSSPSLPREPGPTFVGLTELYRPDSKVEVP